MENVHTESVWVFFSFLFIFLVSILAIFNSKLRYLLRLRFITNIYANKLNISIYLRITDFFFKKWGIFSSKVNLESNRWSTLKIHEFCYEVTWRVEL